MVGCKSALCLQASTGHLTSLLTSIQILPRALHRNKMDQILSQKTGKQNVYII